MHINELEDFDGKENYSNNNIFKLQEFLEWMPLILIDTISIASIRNGLDLELKTIITRNLINLKKIFTAYKDFEDTNINLKIIYLQIFNATNNNTIVGLRLTQYIVDFFIKYYGNFNALENSQFDFKKKKDVIEVCHRNIGEFLSNLNAKDNEQFTYIYKKERHILSESLSSFINE